MKPGRATHEIDEHIALDDDSAGRQSGTRRVARRHTEHPAEPPPDERPTRPVPNQRGEPESTGGAEALRELEQFLRHRVASTAPPDIRELLEPSPALRPRARRTVKVHLTPYAREHAVDDGVTEDTPNSVLLYIARIGSLDQVPYVAASRTALMSQRMDHVAGFILSLIDGASPLETILDLAHMPTHKALRIVHDLWSKGILAFR